MPKSNGTNIQLNPAYKGQPMKPLIAEYEPKKNGVKTELVMVKYKCDGAEAITMQAGSTLPLVETAFTDVDSEDVYDPFDHRIVTHPTSDCDTLIHLLKGSLGSGILSMPLAVLNAGLLTGLLGTFAVGAICTYCVHILVKSSQELCRKRRVPSYGFAETAEAAFLSGPQPLHKYSRLAKALINLFLVIDLLGCCVVYIGFAAKNLKQVVDYYVSNPLDERIYMIILTPFLLMINMIRNLKYLAPFSMVANILIGIGMTITFYYIFTDLPAFESRPNFAEWHQLPMFFGTAIFALEGIGVVMPLENNMKNPRHFIGCPGVLNIGMFFVVSLYSFTGFFGYLKYGDDTKSSITLNLPEDQILAQCVKVMIAVAIFLTYSLQFYVPMDIIWKNIKHKFKRQQNLAEYGVRVFLIILTVVLAIAIPNIGPFISLIGAVCLSTLGLMFPALIELITFWNDSKEGGINWMLIKDSLLILFGVIGFVTGTLVSIKEITESGE